MPALEIAAPDGGKRVLALEKERVTIGRARENDLFLPDRWLSRHHAEIRMGDGGYHVFDLGSKNGTLVNRVPVRESQRLRSGDIITLGEHSITFSDGEDGGTQESDTEPMGTQIFSARELSKEVRTPAGDADTLARQNRILRVLSDAASALVIHRPLGETFERILDLLLEAVSAERAAIVLTTAGGEPEIKAARVRSGPPIKRISRSIARRVVTDRVALLLPNIMEDVGLRGQESILATGIRSALCAPLWLAGTESDTVIGLVYMDSRLGSANFDQEDLRVVTALANLAAAKIENARLLEESLEKRRLEEDMRTAAEIQGRLLPSCAPKVPGYGLVGSTQPCRSVGGDYYDFEMENDKLLLALGDVSGKGTGAALLMAVLRAAVRGHWADEGEISDAMGRINRTLCQNVPANKYVTFFMARLDPGTGELRYVNAGHNPPLLFRAAGATETLEEGGMVLGMFDSVPYGDGVVQLGRGDVLLVYSDGLTEAWDEAGDEFGDKRLAETAVALRSSNVAEIHERVLAAVDAFSDHAKPTDDRTLVVLKRE
jgi:sigma-B regulation protein RsbU (phosphoserine phosphatase)